MVIRRVIKTVILFVFFFLSSDLFLLKYPYCTLFSGITDLNNADLLIQGFKKPSYIIKWHSVALDQHTQPPDHLTWLFFLPWLKVTHVWLYFNNCDTKATGLINILTITLVVLAVYRKANANPLFWGLNVPEAWFHNILKTAI